MSLENNKSSVYYASDREDMLKFVPKEAKAILDIGCGEGNFASLLKVNCNKEVWGVELNEVAGQIAQSKLDKVIISDFGSAARILPKNYFDCIIFNDVIEHFVDPYGVLSKVKELLGNNGIIVGSIPNVRHYYTLYELIIRKDWKYKQSGVMDYSHLRFFTEKSITRMLSDAGYEILRLDGISAAVSIKYKAFNVITLGLLADTKYLKYAFVAKAIDKGDSH